MLVSLMVYLAVTRISISIEWFRLFIINSSIMKRFLLFGLAICMSYLANGQSVLSHDFEDNSYTYIGNSKNTPQEKFKNAKSWIAKFFGDYKRVVQFEDADECKIVLKGKLPSRHDMDTKRTIPDKLIIYYLNSQTEFTLTIEAKEDRYRLKFEDVAVNCSEEKEVKLRTTHTPSKLLSMKLFCSTYKDQATLVKYDLSKLVDSAKDAIEKVSKDDNW